MPVVTDHWSSVQSWIGQWYIVLTPCVLVAFCVVKVVEPHLNEGASIQNWIIPWSPLQSPGVKFQYITEWIWAIWSEEEAKIENKILTNAELIASH